MVGPAVNRPLDEPGRPHGRTGHRRPAAPPGRASMLAPIYRIDMLVGVIELAILGLLREQELHGYELKKRIGDVAGAAGCRSARCTRRWHAWRPPGRSRPSRPPTRARPVPLTGSLAGEASVFRTPAPPHRPPHAGQEVLRHHRAGRAPARGAARTTPPPTTRPSALKVAFCRYLPARPAGSSCSSAAGPACRSSCAPRAAPPVDAAAASGSTPTCGSLREHDRESVERDIAWLDRLIAAEQDGTTGEPAGDATTGSDHP